MDLNQLADNTHAFVKSVVIPREAEALGGSHGPSEHLREELVAAARQAGLLSPQAPLEFGGLGLNQRQRSTIFEAAGYSPLGPTALNCAAPDEGNMHLLDRVASPLQLEQWLRPMAMGSIRSCFCMTEPDNGAGSDPRLMKTRAHRDGSDFIINGRKWLITGADGASLCIIMAMVDGAGATMFLADMKMSGIVIERMINTLDSSFTGGHAVVRFDNLRIPEENILGEVGQGFGYAQVRLAPARLTHCMRWLGSAQRAQDIALDYACNRTAFGKLLADHEGVGFMLADNEIDLRMARLAIADTADLLDSGADGQFESSITKTFVSEAVWRVADRSMQILGGLGLTRDTVVEWIFREVRGFRIYDGPSEVHRWSIAKKLTRQLRSQQP